MKPDSPFYLRTLKILKRSDLFGRLKESVIQDMLASFQRETLPQKCVVMKKEETTQWFYVLISGRVKVTRSNPDTGREFTLFLLAPGDGFDVVPLLDGRKHNVSVVALDDIEALSASFDTIHRWIDRHTEFNRAFLPYIGKQIRTLANLASDQVLYDTSTRLIKLFLEHTTDDTPRPKLKLIHDLSHEELAFMIGSVRVVVNRHLQKLKDEGIILVNRGNLEVKSLHALVNKIERHLDKNNKE